MFCIRAKNKDELKPLFEQITNNINEYKGDVMTYAEELRQEGEYHMAQNMARELLKSGVDESIVAKASHLSKQELDEIKKSLH